jgi:hypothetical protein
MALVTHPVCSAQILYLSVASRFRIKQFVCIALIFITPLPSCSDLPLLAAVNQVSQGIVKGPISGIMGLGFTANSFTNSTPFWQTLASSNQLSAPEFSFFIKRNFDTADTINTTNDGGVMTLGGTNSSFFVNDIDFQDAPAGAQQGFWPQTVTRMLNLFLNGIGLTFTI